MTRQAKAEAIKAMARRLIALGAWEGDPETLNDGDESLLAIMSAMLAAIEKASGRAPTR